MAVQIYLFLSVILNFVNFRFFQSGVEVIFQSDPMHGNTKEAIVEGRKLKTRDADTIFLEIEKAARILKASRHTYRYA